MINSLGEIVVLGLQSRSDRWQRCLEIFEAEGIKKVTRYQTEINHEDKHRGATKDFLELLRKKRGRQIMFFEDDFELTQNWREVLGEAWNEVPKDFDLFYLGANLTSKPVKVSDHVVRVLGAWCLHAVVFSPKFIDYILSSYDVNKHWVFDEWCRVVAPQRKFYMCVPMISYQRESFSDFANKYVSYNLFENKFYKRI